MLFWSRDHGKKVAKQVLLYCCSPSHEHATELPAAPAAALVRCCRSFFKQPINSFSCLPVCSPCSPRARRASHNVVQQILRMMCCGIVCPTLRRRATALLLTAACCRCSAAGHSRDGPSTARPARRSSCPCPPRSPRTSDYRCGVWCVVCGAVSGWRGL